MNTNQIKHEFKNLLSSMPNGVVVEYHREQTDYTHIAGPTRSNVVLNVDISNLTNTDDIKAARHIRGRLLALHSQLNAVIL